MASKFPLNKDSKTQSQRGNATRFINPSEKNCTKARIEPRSPENEKAHKSQKQGLVVPSQIKHEVTTTGKKTLSSPSSSSNMNNMHTLNVDIAVANAETNIVSPGRQCLSDSRLTVRPVRNICVSNKCKRNLDIDGADMINDSVVPLSSPKRKKLIVKGVCNSQDRLGMLPEQDHLDWNQNEKNLSDITPGRRRASWSESSSRNYKNSHCIGHRKVSPRMSNSSNCSPTSKELTYDILKIKSSQKEICLVSKQQSDVSIGCANVQLDLLKNGATSNGNQKRPSYFHSTSNDSVFSDTCAGPGEIDEEKFEKVDNEVAFNRTSSLKSSPVRDRNKGSYSSGRTSPRGSAKQKDNHLKKTSAAVDSNVNTKSKHIEPISRCIGIESVGSTGTMEDGSADEENALRHETLSPTEERKSKKRGHKYVDILPPRTPRTRRVASLTAETKVHLLYERDDIIQKEADRYPPPNKGRTSTSEEMLDDKQVSNQPVTVNPQIFSLKNDAPQEKTEHQINNHTQLKDPTEKTLEKIGEQTARLPSPHQLFNKQTCSRCGKLVTSCSRISFDSDVFVGAGNNSAMSLSCPTKSNNVVKLPLDAGTKTDPASSDQLVCTCPRAHQSISEASVDISCADSLAPLLGPPRRASVDAAECGKLNASLKGPFLLRLSRHSVAAPTSIASQYSLPLPELGLMQTGNLNAHGCTSTNSTLHKANTTSLNGMSGTVTEFITAKSKVVRKVVKRPGLKPYHRRKATNGWKGEGEPVLKPVVIDSEAVQEIRYCYSSIRRKDDVIRTKDCVLLRAGLRKRDLPFVAKVAALYEEPDTGDLMISLLWYYRPEHTEAGRLACHIENELFACRHWDISSVACIEDKCYVVTLAEYNRFYSKLRMTHDCIRPSCQYVPDLRENDPRKDAVPPEGFDPEAVFLCRQVYDFRQRRVLKNPY